MTKHVLTSFSIGIYKDEVLCDVVPMEANHLLLEKPWQFHRRVIHDGYKNRYSFMKDGKKVTLIPLTPRQIYEDQLRIKSTFEEKNKGEKDKESKKRVL